MAPSHSTALELSKQITGHVEEQERAEAEAFKTIKEELDRISNLHNTSQANLERESCELNHKLRNLEQENRNLRIKNRSVEHEKEKLKMMLQEMIGRVNEGNRANHKQQMELNMVTTWWQDSEKENTKLAKNANRLQSQRVEIQDLLDKERNQNRILNLHVQQLLEERTKGKKEYEDLERQLMILQRRAMATPYEVPTPRLKSTELYVCIEMEDMEEEEPAENLQKEEKGQDLTSEPQKDTSQDLRSQEHEEKNLEMDLKIVTKTPKTKQKMEEEEEKLMTLIRHPSWSEVSGCARAPNKADTMPKAQMNDSKAPTISSQLPEHNRQLGTRRKGLKDRKGDMGKNKMEEEEEKLMTPIRHPSWSEVSGCARAPNKAETMPKAQMNDSKAPSISSQLPEHNRQLGTRRKGLKDRKGDMGKNKMTSEGWLLTAEEHSEKNKLINYWKSRAFVLEVVDET